MSGFSASKEQRAKVREMPCAYCFRTVGCDPAHLLARAQGGCDDPLCVIPLCREHHTKFDLGLLDLEPVLAGSRWCQERSHMALHASFAQCVQRLRGRG